MTRRQKRILIAKAIKFSVYAIGVVGVLVMLSGTGILENPSVPISHGIALYIAGLALIAFSLYAYYKIYEED